MPIYVPRSFFILEIMSIKRFITVTAWVALAWLAGSCAKEEQQPRVSGVVMEPASAEIYVGESLQLTVEVQPSEAVDTKVRFDVSREGVISVSESGEVTGLAPGEAYAIAITNDGGYAAMSRIVVKSREESDDDPNAAEGDPEPYGACPTDAQVAWIRMETNMFIHFGPNTFTDFEWGSGQESETVFNPVDENGNPVDADVNQWVSVAKRNGFQGIVLTAKHHDGFCLWPYEYSTHTIANSPYKNGKGNLVKELGDECKAQGVKFGVYISPADLNDVDYGTGEAYNRKFAASVEEIHSQYELFEQWFDGANGGTTKHQEYDFDLFNSTVLKYNPDCIIFSNVGPGCRWVGNEYGFAKETCWATFTPSKHNVSQSNCPGDYGTYLGSGDENGQYWMPAESDVSIRTKDVQDNGDPMWFWNNLGNEYVRSAKNIMKLYYQSVGRNSLLLLNVPPATNARFEDADVASLDGFKAMKDEIFKTNLAAGATVTASASRDNGNARYAPANLLDDDFDTYFAAPDNQRSVDIEFKLAQPSTFNRVLLQEYIPLGQRVKSFTVYYKESESGAWKTLKSGTTIGHKRILLTNSVNAVAVKLSITGSLACPVLNGFGLYNDTVSGLTDSDLDK